MIFDCNFLTLPGSWALWVCQNTTINRETGTNLSQYQWKISHKNFACFEIKSWDLTEFQSQRQIDIDKACCTVDSQDRLLIILTEAGSCPWSSVLTVVLSSFSTSSNLTNNGLLTRRSDWTTVGCLIIVFSLTQSPQLVEGCLYNWTIWTWLTTNILIYVSNMYSVWFSKRLTE